MITSRASNIPDFSMVLSHAEHVITAVQGDVTINCFYTQNKERAEQRLSIAEDVVRFYRDLYGFYPGTWLNIVAYDRGGGGGGPVGSNIVYVLKDKLDWGVAHEIGHEYWGWNWVTGVPDTDPERNWLCLGMGLWSDRQYIQARNIACPVYSDMLDEYLDAARVGLNTKLEKPTEKDLQRRMREKDLLHDKGYAIALMLEHLLGKDVLREIAKTTLERFAHRAIDAKDFQGVCEEMSGQKLDWFFHQWVYTSDSLDYAVVGARTTKAGSKDQIAVLVEAKGPARMPVDIALELTDGTVVQQHLPRSPRSEQRCIFASDKPWRRVVIDPDKYLPDTNRFDNVLVAGDGKLDPGERQAIQEFYEVRRKILAGENYEDTSTPLRACLTVLSYLRARDASGFKRMSALSHDDENLDPKLTDKQMADLQQRYGEFDILRTPLPPGQPEGEMYWPIYVRKPDRAELANTFVFVFRDKNWKWFGNFGSEADWRTCIKEKLSEWEQKEKYKGDPFLTSETSEAEAQVIERFRKIKEKILVGEKYQDMSTPVDLLLTVMSAVYSRDAEAYKRAAVWDYVNKKKKSAEQMNQFLDSWRQGIVQYGYDILRAPLPPKDPNHGTFWPIYMKDAATGKWDGTIVPVFWKGKWQWAGNIGSPRDWRPYSPSRTRSVQREGK